MSGVSVDFEVFGKVQGTNFIKIAKELAEENEIFGWIRNSRTGSIQGRAQGEKESMNKMLKFLSEDGSPGSHIEKCNLQNRQAIMRPDYTNFAIKF